MNHVGAEVVELEILHETGLGRTIDFNGEQPLAVMQKGQHIVFIKRNRHGCFLVPVDHARQSPG